MLGGQSSQRQQRQVSIYFPEMCEKLYHVISQNEVRTNGKKRQREITKVA